MKFDQILVVDIESTCWEEELDENVSEVIEIGITPIDTKTGELLETRDIIVRPENSKVSEFCTKLTTLTQDYVDTGISFKDACDILVKEFNSHKHAWASYGHFDKKQFENQCIREGIIYPFAKTHINVKILFALRYSLKRDIGMMKALRLLGMPHTGTHHRGGDDSRNIAKILRKILYNKDDE